MVALTLLGLMPMQLKGLQRRLALHRLHAPTASQNTMTTTCW